VCLCQSSVVGVTDASLLNQVSECGNQCASSYRELLQQIHVVSNASFALVSILDMIIYMHFVDQLMFILCFT